MEYELPASLPVLVLTARRDRLFGKRARQRLLAIAPHAKHVEVDAPHLVLQVRAREVAEILVAWLRSAPDTISDDA